MGEPLLSDKVDPYHMLGVSRSATWEEMRSAYRRHLHSVHPDHHTGPRAKHRFALLQEAWALVSTPERRADYDRRHPPRPSARARRPAPRPQRPRQKPTPRPEMVPQPQNFERDRQDVMRAASDELARRRRDPTPMPSPGTAQTDALLPSVGLTPSEVAGRYQAAQDLGTGVQRGLLTRLFRWSLAG